VYVIGFSGYNRPRMNGRKVGVPMIRAVVQNGLIRPLEPLPAEWTEGRRVVVEDADSTSVEDLEGWCRELQRLGPAEYEPGEASWLTRSTSIPPSIVADSTVSRPGSSPTTSRIGRAWHPRRS